MADFVGMMERSMKEILLIIIFRGKASISDQTERAIREAGRTIFSMAKVRNMLESV